MRGGANGTFGPLALAVVAAALSMVAGYVDAIGWTLLSHVYVANMSGNSIALGRGLALGELAETAARVWPIVLFILGLFLSEIAYELAARRGRRSGARWTLGLEAILILLMVLLPWPAPDAPYGLAWYGPTGLLAIAMGLQNATLIRVGASSVYTTHITGNLTRLAREAAHALLSLGAPVTGTAEERRQGRLSRRRVALMALLWSLYTIGAALGTLAAGRWKRHGAAFAVAALAILVAVDVLRPIGGHEPPIEAHPMF